MSIFVIVSQWVILSIPDLIAYKQKESKHRFRDVNLKYIGLSFEITAEFNKQTPVLLTLHKRHLLQCVQRHVIFDLAGRVFLPL